jgi:hypothetical protein
MPYKTSAGIPFILRYPNKVQEGKIINSATSTVDFVPSILSLMGVGDPGVSFDGIDFSNEVTNGSSIANDHRTRFMASYSWAAAIKDEFKLIVSKTDVPWLFDLNVDPFEVQNMFDDPNYTEVRVLLQNKLLKAIQDNDLSFLSNKNGEKALFWETPACLDSRDRIQNNSDFFTCADIGTLLSNDKCSESRFKEHCPVTCQDCCKDSIGKLLFGKKLRGCDKLKKKCQYSHVEKFCPSTCGIC